MCNIEFAPTFFQPLSIFQPLSNLIYTQPTPPPEFLLFSWFSEMPRCSICNNNFNTRKLVTRHQDKACQATLKLTTALSNVLGFSEMKRNHSNKFQCPFEQCNFAAVSIKNTTYHMGTHLARKNSIQTMEDISSTANNGPMSSGMPFVQYLQVNTSHFAQCQHSKPSQNLWRRVQPQVLSVYVMMIPHHQVRNLYNMCR